MAVFTAIGWTHLVYVVRLFLTEYKNKTETDTDSSLSLDSRLQSALIPDRGLIHGQDTKQNKNIKIYPKQFTSH